MHPMKAIARLALLLLLAMTTLPAFTGPIHAAQPAAGARSRYEIDATLDPGLSRLDATLALDWANTTGIVQRSLFFRLYPNADSYGNGAIDLFGATAAGAAVTPVIGADPTVMELLLPEAVAPGARVAITIRFRTAVPTDAVNSLGILQRDVRDVWALADWYPIVAGFEPASGWYLDPPTIFGDPTLSETADYRIRVTAPAGYTLLGSGTESTSARTGGRVLTEFDAPTAREFAMTVLPGAEGAGIAVRRSTVGDTGLTVSLPQLLAIPGVEDLLLETAAAAFPVYEAMLGAYPEGNIDLTFADLGGASGVSWAGVIWVDLEPFVADGEVSEIERLRLRFLVVHEMGHQWIGNIVGANTNDHQFLGEGLDNVLTIAAFREIDGVEMASRYLRADVASPYVALLADGRDGVVDVPVSNSLDVGTQSILVYGKAAIGFEAIRQQIGNDAFLRAIAAYATTFRFGLGTPADLLAAFEAASGAGLDATWSFWFQSATATVADVEVILDAYAAT